MEDVEPLEEFRPGHSIDEIQIRLELYRLVTMILASGEINWCSKFRDRAGYHTYFLQGLAGRYFEDELSRILSYVAIQGRLYSSMKYPSSFSHEIPELVFDLGGSVRRTGASAKQRYAPRTGST